MSFFEALFGTREWKTSDQVVVTDVTRMQGDRVCIAALDRRKTIRLHDPQPNEQWLRSIGGLTPGDRVSVTWKLPRSYHRPHSEDRDWNMQAFRKVDRLSEDELASLLTGHAFCSVYHAFGKPSFYSERGNAAFRPGRGPRSLASVVVNSLRVYPYGDGIRVDFHDAEREWTMAPLEDLIVRNHQSRCSPCLSQLPDLLASEFEGGNAMLRVGLTRPLGGGHSATGCYLQVNYIFLLPSKRRHFV